MKLRERYGWECTIGTQAIALEDNLEELYPLAKTMKKIGVDYLVIKPLSVHEEGTCKNLKSIRIPDNIKKKLSSKFLNRGSFRVIIREQAFSNLKEDKPYDECYAKDFMGYIDSKGGVHSCINFIDNEEYEYGNINDDNFIDIWSTKQIIKPDLDKCRDVCRMDLINRYLWELKNPQEHVNFI
ncbi:unnamed protein product [marine sediment metagenome]|uniref:4Fe4S-binding SPASM domain-containing protein n=1 Tax=marine sediment metagenome TaxID=412755 RepID=X1A4M8_9ZZZZ